MLSTRKQSLLTALADMRQHEQGNHGWSLFHECLSKVGESESSGGLDRLLSTMWRQRPHISDAHAITLLGIAVRQLALQDEGLADVFRAELSVARRVPALADALSERALDVMRLMESHSNSYTGARRFLVPQLVVGAFAAFRNIRQVRFLDLGTSVGLLPRQLNNKAVYDRFAGDLHWHPAPLPFRVIPLDYVGGVDRPPLPTLDWVRACHGPSDYYEQRFEEVRWSLGQAETAGTEVALRPLDILDFPALEAFLRAHRINVVTCNFVLYQYSDDIRNRVVETVMRALEPPGLLLSMEPSHALARMGCVVHAYQNGSTRPLHVADVSDGHFMGTVTVRDGLTELVGPGGGQ
ncbi:hypothetical protein ADK57_28030 [Streptomyces sp. MMG1533]|uniref:hypothetical protein n=1 Tax=Streptomyces sp. MMG1533 TaxID=1415546 RepID=UPI0006AF28CA|nr:hypothetical protein [Streptomyces sp. MMG1533]KOU61311.1 hypothetical protein ADK57_28030 [Streptomyces sp. MMG1533]